MTSDFYDQFVRWEPLAEFQIIADGSDEYRYVLCSRALIKNEAVSNVSNDIGTESETEEVVNDSFVNEDEAHVKFILEHKREKDETASCYCSASHTDNCCSTDEHDTVHNLDMPHPLQSSDSGADLTFLDGHFDSKNQDNSKIHNSNQFEENYLSGDTWEKFWAVNGERLIWASWINKYSDYINPSYLDENNHLMMDENNVPQQEHEENNEAQQENEQNCKDINTKTSNGLLSDYDNNDNSARERKHSFDSKINPYKTNAQQPTVKTPTNSELTLGSEWLPIGRQRSSSEHERIVSPRTFTGTDSMTNITKCSASTYDMTSSFTTSASSPTDEYSISSSEESKNDQTRIANDLDDVTVEEQNADDYWQLLWKKHFGEQYAIHYANYIECCNTQMKNAPPKDETSEEVETKASVPSTKTECDDSEDNSQDTPTVIEIQNEIENMNLENTSRRKKRKKKSSNQYITSVGVLLQKLLEEQSNSCNDADNAVDANDSTENKVSSDLSENSKLTSVEGNHKNNDVRKGEDYDEDGEPPEEKAFTLKRSHELDIEEMPSEKIRTTFEIMGFSMVSAKMPKGELIYKKRHAKLRPPRFRKYGMPKKTYFDDEGNPYTATNTECNDQDDRDMQTDNECPDINSSVDNEIDRDVDQVVSEQIIDDSNITDEKIKCNLNLISEAKAESNFPDESDAVDVSDIKKRKRRWQYPRKWDRQSADCEMPEELRKDPKMFKYWAKRHSLFHRFDEGIKLDVESWFSVTPERVARHVASRCADARHVVLDAFCGAGGNAIQFALACHRVIAIDIDPVKVGLARHNAEVYGVADRIDFIVGDFFDLAEGLVADSVFLSPPWGGPEYSNQESYDLETMLKPRPASELVTVARTISSNVTLYLPRNSRSDQLLSLPNITKGSVEIEQNFLGGRFVAITAYFY